MNTPERQREIERAWIRSGKHLQNLDALKIPNHKTAKKTGN